MRKNHSDVMNTIIITLIILCILALASAFLYDKIMITDIMSEEIMMRQRGTTEDSQIMDVEKEVQHKREFTRKYAPKIIKGEPQVQSGQNAG